MYSLTFRQMSMWIVPNRAPRVVVGYPALRKIPIFPGRWHDHPTRADREIEVVSHPREHLNVTLGILGTVAGIVGAVATVVALLPDRGPTNPVSAPSTMATSSAATVALTPSSRPATSDLLVHLTPADGLPSLTDLPEALQGKPEYADSVAIACPTNESGQKQAEVRYESRSLYRGFTATLEAYREPAEGVRMQLFVFLDPQNRDFGIDGEKPGGGQAQLRAGETQTFTSDVGGAYYVRFRLICEKPGGMLILRQGAFTPGHMG
jgi:hypothetical protein